MTLEVNNVPLSPCNDVGRPNLGMISWSRFFYHLLSVLRVFPDSSVGKESTCNTGGPCSNPGLGRSPGEGKGSPLQYSGLDNSIDSPWGCKESDTTEWFSLSQPSQSGWEGLQSTLWMYLSRLIGIYTLEKLASGWSPTASPLLGRSHTIGWPGPALWACHPP